MYWSRLEQRSKQVIDTLQYAAKERCKEEEKHSTLRRKDREKQKKAQAAIQDILTRASKNENTDALNFIYAPLCTLIEERSEMRKFWFQRETDRVFRSMPLEYKPIPIPFRFEQKNASNQSASSMKEYADSPLGGTFQDLKRLSDNIRKCGMAYMTKNSNDLPIIKKEEESDQGDMNNVVPKVNATSNDRIKKERKQPESKSKDDEQIMPLDVKSHHQELDWMGWQNNTIGLEMQHPWSQLLLNGSKTIETRSYDLPKALIGKKILVLESQPGKDGVSSLGNILSGDAASKNVKAVGWMKFDRVITYRYRSEFEADENKHLVKRDSGYAWEEETKVVYGWVVKSKGFYKKKVPTITRITRRMRSLFSIE